MEKFITLPIFSLLILFSLVLPSRQEDAPIVEILTGKIKGEVKESRLDRDFYAYRGIPYARPPVGELRFEPPQKPDNWTNVKEAEEYGKLCTQYSSFEKKVIGSEDCLFINVFTPKIGSGFSSKLLPVMVFIHGGSFMTGTADVYRPHYFMDEDIVIVTFNYRVGSFGFLSTDDEVVRGNMGLKDQVMALEWVRDNIQKFSGDSAKVTIFGEDAGATSIHFLLLSPMAQGLFHKAISQSGNAFKISALQAKPKATAVRLAGLLNCEKILNDSRAANETGGGKSNCFLDNSSQELVKCLKLVDAKKIAEIHQEAFQPLRDRLAIFGPVVENNFNNLKSYANDTFLPEHPYSLLISGKQKRIPWMTGINAHEGLVTTGVILNDQAIIDQIETKWEELSPKFLNYDKARLDVTNQIRNFYLNFSQVEELTNTTSNAAPKILDVKPINFGEQFMSFTNMFTDRFYATPFFESILIQSKFSNVYVYYNTYEGQYSMLDVITGKSKEPTPAYRKVKNWFKTKILGRKAEIPKHLGVCSGDELLLLFKYPELKIKDNAHDFEMSKDLAKLWVQFAYDDTKMVFRNSTWSPLNTKAGGFQVMRFGNSINETGIRDIGEDFKNRMNLWHSLPYISPFEQ